jgi:predicted phage tail protein
MIDYNSLAIADQTHIENVSFRTGLVAPPDDPTNLVANASGGKVGLNWDDNAEPDIRGYDVFRSTTSGGPYTAQNGAPVIASAFTDSSVSPGTTYYYVIQAQNDAGQVSGYSNEANATP